MIQLAHRNASGARRADKGRLYTRSRSGFCLSSAASATGAAEYISTDALVTTPTSALQLGKGSRNSNPMRAAKMTPNTGTLVRESVRSNAVGTKPFRLRAKLSRADEVV